MVSSWTWTPVFFSMSMKRPAYSGPVSSLAEAVQTEAVVDALVQDAAQLLVPLQNQNIHAGRSSQALQAAARPAGPPPITIRSYHVLLSSYFRFAVTSTLVPGLVHAGCPCGSMPSSRADDLLHPGAAETALAAAHAGVAPALDAVDGAWRACGLWRAARISPSVMVSQRQMTRP